MPNYNDGVTAIRIHKQDLGGINSTRELLNVKVLLVEHTNQTYVYEVLKVLPDSDSNAYYFTVKPNHNLAPIGSANSAVTFKPYVAGKFKNSNFDALLGNGTDVRTSGRFYKVDDEASQLVPSNLDGINSRSLPFADIQDSNYYSKAYTNPRYNGSKHTADGLHSQSFDTGLVPISNPQSYFSYFNWLGGTSPTWGNNINDRVAANLKYLISLDGETITPTNDAEGLNLSLIEQNFRTGEQATIALDSDSNSKFYSLNGTWDIFKSGKRIEPIIYSQTQSVENNEVTGYGVADSLTFYSSGIPNSDVTSDMRFSAALFRATEIKDSNVPFVVNFINDYSGPNAQKQTVNGDDSVQLDPASADNGKSFNIAINAAIGFLPKTTSYRNIITIQIQRRIGSGAWTTLVEGAKRLSSSNLLLLEYADTLNNQGSNPTYDYRVRVSAVDKSSLAQAVEIDPNRSWFKLAQSPTNQNTATSSYWTVDGFNRNFISASTGDYGLSTFYTNKQNDIDDSGFSNLRYPFTIEEGDEIRFQASEEYAYRINEVVSEQPELILKLDQAIPVGINTDMFLVRRYIDDPSSIILDVDKPAGGTSGGILKPEFMPPGAERELQKVVQTLRRQNQI